MAPKWQHVIACDRINDFEWPLLVDALTKLDEDGYAVLHVLSRGVGPSGAVFYDIIAVRSS